MCIRLLNLNCTLYSTYWVFFLWNHFRTHTSTVFFLWNHFRTHTSTCTQPTKLSKCSLYVGLLCSRTASDFIKLYRLFTILFFVSTATFAFVEDTSVEEDVAVTALFLLLSLHSSSSASPSMNCFSGCLVPTTFLRFVSCCIFNILWGGRFLVLLDVVWFLKSLLARLSYQEHFMLPLENRDTIEEVGGYLLGVKWKTLSLLSPLSLTSLRHFELINY